MKYFVGFILGLIVVLIVNFFVVPRVKQASAERSMLRFFSSFHVTPMPYHTFTKISLRSFLGRIFPQYYSYMNDETLSKIKAKLDKIYKNHLDAVRHPPTSDEDMVGYLKRVGLLGEMQLNQQTALQKIQTINSAKHFFKPKAAFTRYYSASPPNVSVRQPGEFENMGAIILGWPVYYPGRWKFHAQFVQAIITADSSAYILVPNEYWQKAVELYLQSKNIPLDKVKFIRLPLDDVWTRDYGPIIVESTTDHKPIIIANPYIPIGGSAPYQKNSFEAPLEIGRYFNLPVYRLPFVIEGGNIYTDGKGTYILFDSVLSGNPQYTKKTLEKVMEKYLGCKKLILLPTLRGELLGHIDMAVKFVDADTLVVAQSEPSYKWYKELENLAKELAQIKSANGNYYKVVRVPIVSHPKEKYDFWSYANSLTLNNTVIVPLYDVPEDKVALDAYKKAMPNYRIVGISFSDFPGGAAHCQSKEVPAFLTRTF